MNGQPNTPQRVSAVKGFYAHIQGNFRVVNPGDVVDLDRNLAAMMIASSKAKPVDASTPIKIQENYVPERLRNPVAADPNIERLDRLQATVERLAESVALLVAAQADKAKK